MVPEEVYGPGFVSQLLPEDCARASLVYRASLRLDRCGRRYPPGGFHAVSDESASDLSEAAMRGYLYRTAESLIVDQWRRSKREEQRDIAAYAQRGEALASRDDSDIHRALAKLKPQQRSLLWLAYVEELDHRQIAATAGIKEKSVRVLLFRARRTLAGILTRAGHGPEVADAK
jgi:RNA polymerase sigma factor (sigma-70 family)